VHDELLTALRKYAEALVVGDPFDDATDIGPLIAPAATKRVKSWIDEAAGAGASVVAGGEVVGECLRPTVIDQAPLGTRLRESEAFGPVLTVLEYNEPTEAFALANETVYGLQAGVFTRDLDLALTAVSQLDFGGILVNDVPTTRLDQQPYGGMGESGNTREGPSYTAREMTEVRHPDGWTAPSPNFRVCDKISVARSSNCMSQTWIAVLRPAVEDPSERGDLEVETEAIGARLEGRHQLVDA